MGSMSKRKCDDNRNSKGKKTMQYKQHNTTAQPMGKKVLRDTGFRNQKKRLKPNTENDAAAEDFNPRNMYKNDEAALRHLLIKPGSKWFEQVPKDPEVSPSLKSETLLSYRTEAQTICKEDCERYQHFLEKRKEKADFTWMKTILRSGTLSDKISAHTLLIQDSPVYNVFSIEALISMVNTKGKREFLLAVDSLKDLFLSDLLPEERKLKSFAEHPFERLDELTNFNVVTRKKRLLLWYFEDQLKNLYGKFVENLELVSRDTVEKTKQKSVTIMFELLKENPEQEQFLLEHLVNKIGDPIPKVGSHVCYLLGQLVHRHKDMVPVVVKEVERLLFRQNVAERAKYYCLCFYNQLIFSEGQSSIANHLITMYFGLFKMCVKKGEVNTKMMSALLTGVSRAYPYAKLKNNVLMEQLDAMFRLVHTVSFNISVQALMLIFQVLDSNDSISDRFYCALYRKMLDPAVSNSTRQSMLLNLIHRALKKDVANVRVKAFVKRLIQVSLYQTPNFQCGILMLISSILKTRPDLLETNRFVMDSESESDEHFDDVVDCEGDNEDTSLEVGNTSNNVPRTSSWVHRPKKHSKRSKTGYDPQHRNPLHAGAEYCKLWELCLLNSSFHPSVSLFAHQVSSSKDINYSGDPLADFALIRFLDRFVYRNPKKLSNSAMSSVHRKVFGRKQPLKSDSEQMPITSDVYIKQKEEKVPVEERFIYSYLRQRASSGKRKGGEESDVESVGSDEFEALLNEIHPEDEGKDTLDFAKELSTQRLKSSNKNKRSEAEDKESSIDSFEEDSDLDEVNFEDDEEFKSAFDEFDQDMEESMQNEPDFTSNDFMDYEGDEIRIPSKQSKRKQEKKNDDKLFASADEFSNLLEENVAVGIDTTSSEAILNYDKSAAKQLAWEKQRDQFVRGVEWKSRRRNKFKKLHSRKKM